jgi:hypothetical protein
MRLSRTPPAVQQTSERVVTRCRTTAPVAAPAAISHNDEASASAVGIARRAEDAEQPCADQQPDNRHQLVDLQRACVGEGRTT